MLLRSYYTSGKGKKVQNLHCRSVSIYTFSYSESPSFSLCMSPTREEAESKEGIKQSYFMFPPKTINMQRLKLSITILTRILKSFVHKTKNMF